jgi:hypothetical protein
VDANLVEGLHYHIGVSFLSPKGTGQRLAVLFNPPIDRDNIAVLWGGNTPEFHQGEKKWKRTGDTMDTLTLEPSLDFSAHGEWHGFVKNGEVT